MHTSVVKYTQPKSYEKRTSFIPEMFSGKEVLPMEKAVQTEAREVQDLSSVQFLTITAAFVALTYIFTAFINVKLPIAANGGLIHLGNVPLFIGAILFGKKTGAIAGGIGMGLFDLLSGWTLWAPFTLVIVESWDSQLVNSQKTTGIRT